MAKSIKKLREEAEAIKEIATKNDLLDALDILEQLETLNEINASNLAKCRKLEKSISDLCTEYAVTHQTDVFDGGGMNRNQNGVHVGDITDGDVIHHLSLGFRGYIRSNGEMLTQDFLAALPKGWRKSKIELDVTGINKAVDKGADPSKYGLIDKPNNEWTHKLA